MPEDHLNNKNGFIVTGWLIAGGLILVALVFLAVKNPGNLLSYPASLALQSFEDVFGNGQKKLAVEIDLNNDVNEGDHKDVLDNAPNESDRGASNNINSEKLVAVPESGSVNLKNQEAVKSPKENLLSDDSNQSKVCSFSGVSQTASRKVLLNEIAWMGTSSGAADEWLELKNISGAEINISDWQILDAHDQIKIVLGGKDKRGVVNGKIAAGGFYLLERTDDNAVANIFADYVYVGSLANDGREKIEGVKLFDADCNLIDEVATTYGVSGKDWPSGDNSSKKTMERNLGDFGWHTSVKVGGTPGAENSNGPTNEQNQNQSSAPLSSYNLGVSISGDGTGYIVSNPLGINCGSDCSKSFLSGTPVVLTASSSASSVFDGWSGACAGTGSCNLALTANLSVIAAFRSVAVPQNPASPPPAANNGSILISEIMAGSSVSSGDEFVELYNPGDSAVDLTGWYLKKKSSTGSESSLVVSSRLEGKIVPPRAYFLIAHDGDYGGTAVPDATWPASYTLAYTNNTVLVYNPQNEVKDEVSWTDIPKDQSFERVSFGGSNFQIQPVPSPRNSTGQ